MSFGKCSSRPTIGWARRRRRSEQRWVFRGQDGGAPGTERPSRAASDQGPGARPWRWSSWRRLDESEPSAVWDRGHREHRGAGKSVAGGPRLAAKRCVPGGDTWTPQEREEALACRCCGSWVGLRGPKSFVGGSPAEVGTLRRFLGTPEGQSRAPETWPLLGRQAFGIGLEG